MPLAWFRYFLEEQEELLGPDPWLYGLGEINKNALETLIAVLTGAGSPRAQNVARRTLHQHGGAFMIMENAGLARGRITGLIEFRWHKLAASLTIIDLVNRLT